MIEGTYGLYGEVYGTFNYTYDHDLLGFIYDVEEGIPSTTRGILSTGWKVVGTI